MRRYQMKNKVYRPAYGYKKKLTLLSFLVAFGLMNVLVVKAQSGLDQITVDERVEKVEDMPRGPFVRLGENEILAASGPTNHILISEDNGQSWQAHRVFENSDQFLLSGGAVQHTDNGVVIIAFSNRAERHWTWSNKLGDALGARLPTYVVRSLDNGRTWEEPQLLHEEWTGANLDMIKTSNGNIIFTSMKMLHNPGRHSVLTYMSTDQGQTWHPSNIIDLGGAGHHGGVTEATIEELRDGRLMGLMRTNWMEFWRIESNDGGRSWHPIGPSGIPSSSAPGMLKRLDSGRLLLVWNWPYPEGEHSYPLRGGDRNWSAVPVSNHRAELSIAFSEDDGETWSDHIVIAKSTGRGVIYPKVFEVAPGEIWVTAGALCAKFYEKDFVNGAQN